MFDCWRGYILFLWELQRRTCHLFGCLFMLWKLIDIQGDRWQMYRQRCHKQRQGRTWIESQIWGSSNIESESNSSDTYAVQVSFCESCSNDLTWPDLTKDEFSFSCYFLLYIPLLFSQRNHSHLPTAKPCFFHPKKKLMESNTWTNQRQTNSSRWNIRPLDPPGDKGDVDSQEGRELLGGWDPRTDVSGFTKLFRYLNWRYSPI